MLSCEKEKINFFDALTLAITVRDQCAINVSDAALNADNKKLSFYRFLIRKRTQTKYFRVQ